jgi:hypothetical protein
MAITSPVAIRFSDTRIRPAADLLAQLDNFAHTVINEWNAGASAEIPNTEDVLRDSASPVDDAGTQGDGRPVVTGAELTNIIVRLQELRAAVQSNGLAMSAPGVRDTVLAVAVNTTR